MVLVYAGIVPVKASTVSPKLRDLQIRAKILMHQLARDKDTVILPTIVISELLVPVPDRDHGPLIARITERFVCPPFDVRAAAVAADLWVRHSKLPAKLQYSKRNVLKADTMIIASAKSSGATVFCTTDRKCRALANIVMKGWDLPKDDPSDMFLKADIERGEL